MEKVFSDALGLFGAETVEDDEFVHYGGLKLGIVPKVFFQTTGRLIAMCVFRRAGYIREIVCSRDKESRVTLKLLGHKRYGQRVVLSLDSIG